MSLVIELHPPSSGHGKYKVTFRGEVIVPRPAIPSSTLAAFCSLRACAARSW